MKNADFRQKIHNGRKKEHIMPIGHIVGKQILNLMAIKDSTQTTTIFESNHCNNPNSQAN
jgi:hypothetical protein